MLFLCWRQKLLLDCLYVLCDAATRVLNFLKIRCITRSCMAVPGPWRNRHQGQISSQSALFTSGCWDISSPCKGIAPSQPLAQYARGYQGWPLFISIHFTKIFWSYGVTHGESCGLNGSAQHMRKVYSQESADAARSCPVRIACSRRGCFSWEGIVAASDWCFRLRLAARGCNTGCATTGLVAQLS